MLLIVIDTLRNDRVGAQRAGQSLTPHLDALASAGTRFDSAFAHAPWTLPSFSSIFSGLIPEHHGAGGVADHYLGLQNEITTWPECFRSAGYATAAIVNVDFLSSVFGATQGFDALDAWFTADNHRMRDAQKTTDLALRWIDKRKPERPFLLFVHYFDPHAEYRPPPPFRRRFADPRDQDTDTFTFGSREDVVNRRNKHLPLVPDDVERAAKLYDGEVASTDEQIGRLLEGLASKGLAKDTLVVFSADHGEEFLDHGGWEHGHSLYDELLHVPLVLRWPGRIPTASVSAAVGHIDLAPTLCALCKVAPAQSFEGRDLAPSWNGGALAPLAQHAYGNFWGPPLESVRDERFVLIVAPAQIELYDWRADPLEHTNLAPGQPPALALLRGELTRLRERAHREGWRAGPPVQLSAKIRQQLQNTGYGGDIESGK